MHCGEEKIPAAVPGKHPAGPVGAVGCGCESDDEDACVVGSESGNRLAPVDLVPERRAFGHGDFFAPRDQAGAGTTVGNERIKFGDGAGLWRATGRSFGTRFHTSTVSPRSNAARGLGRPGIVKIMQPALADVIPSVAKALVGEAENVLGISPARDVVVLLVDGLGAELIKRHAEAAPTLVAAMRATLAAGFPATTATSLSSLAVGAPCATHGIVGYSFAVPGPEPDGQLLNALRWRVGEGKGSDARESLPPESVQTVPSAIEGLAASGIDIHYVVPSYQVRSGLTRASFRAPGVLHPAASLDEVRAGILEVARHDGLGSRFAYAYYPDLDMNGHLCGPGSAEWLTVLAAIDAMIADLFTELPDTCTLLVTGDHGMVRAGAVIDLDADPNYWRDVRLLAGEARVRHVYARVPQAAADIASRWSALLGHHARVVTREQALDERWFGATPPTATINARIGDVLAVADGTSILASPSREPMESAMAGHHGAWTAEEQLIPLITNR